MGTLILVAGENGSGKSRCAENIVARTTGRRYYIATMQPCSEENLRRFTESESLSESGRNSLLETYRISLSDEIWTGVRELEEKCENLVIVSDFVFSDGAVYDSLTELYICLLGDLWRKIAEQADEVTEIVFGLPVKLKQRGRSSMRSAGN